MSERLFGTDGIRGEANVYPMTPEVALRVGRAAGYLFRKDDNPHTVLIGKDTRQSGYMIETALTAGFCSMGINVRLVGPLPTPGVSYIMRSLRADAGVMISASHNPYYDNGIKFFARDGYKLPDEIEDEIERLVLGTEIDSVRPTGTRLGRARRIEDAGGRFIEYAKSTFPRGMRLDGLKIVCDAANGAAYHVGPDTLSELGAEVVPLGVNPDGTNINANCGSMFPEVMRSKVITEKAHLGIAFDGDGDRVLMADEDGRMLDGNALLAILATDMIERKALPKKTLVTTIMANGGLERVLAPIGGKLVRTKVGDRYVVEAMRREGFMLGGESSGHIIMLDYNTTGDALITVLQLLATMVRRERRLSDLARGYEAMPERHAKVPIQHGARPSEEALDKVRKKAEAELNGQGRVVIRPSGTEPVIRVMVQHVSDRAAETLVQELADDISAL